MEFSSQITLFALVGFGYAFPFSHLLSFGKRQMESQMSDGMHIEFSIYISVALIDLNNSS